MVFFGMPVIGMLLAASISPAADFAVYRGFAFGSSVEATAKLAGTKMSGVRTVHTRPARIEEFDWEPGAYSQVDSVRDGLLRFYNGQLFQIVVTYDRQRTEGMSTADMIDSISATYGAATRPTADIPMKSIYGDVARVLARWENPAYIYDLVRTGDQTSFALILRSKQLDSLATDAIVAAEKLDAKEAPERADALQRKLDAETRVALEKARATNKSSFRP
jgi:hypothetical protein